MCLLCQCCCNVVSSAGVLGSGWWLLQCRTLGKQDLEEDRSFASTGPLANAWSAETKCGGSACHGAHQVHAVSGRHHWSAHSGCIAKTATLGVCHRGCQECWCLYTKFCVDNADIRIAAVYIMNGGQPPSLPPASLPPLALSSPSTLMTESLRFCPCRSPPSSPFPVPKTVLLSAPS